MVAQQPLLPVACALEAYSVLTRMPAPNRAPPELVGDFLRANFAGRLVALSDSASDQLVSTLVERGVWGGAAYDGAIALAANEAGAILLTLDRRAGVSYDRIGVDWHSLARSPRADGR